jgi:hypothetical protein
MHACMQHGILHMMCIHTHCTCARIKPAKQRSSLATFARVDRWQSTHLVWSPLRSRCAHVTRCTQNHLQYELCGKAADAGHCTNHFNLMDSRSEEMRSERSPPQMHMIS